MSVDQLTWTDLPDTIQAKTKVSGLTPGQTYYFKQRAITKQVKVTGAKLSLLWLFN